MQLQHLFAEGKRNPEHFSQYTQQGGHNPHQTPVHKTQVCSVTFISLFELQLNLLINKHKEKIYILNMLHATFLIYTSKHYFKLYCYHHMHGIYCADKKLNAQPIMLINTRL